MRPRCIVKWLVSGVPQPFPLRRKDSVDEMGRSAKRRLRPKRKRAKRSAHRNGHAKRLHDPGSAETSEPVPEQKAEPGVHMQNQPSASGPIMDWWRNLIGNRFAAGAGAKRTYLQSEGLSQVGRGPHLPSRTYMLPSGRTVTVRTLSEMDLWQPKKST